MTVALVRRSRVRARAVRVVFFIGRFTSFRFVMLFYDMCCFVIYGI